MLLYNGASKTFIFLMLREIEMSCTILQSEAYILRNKHAEEHTPTRL